MSLMGKLSFTHKRPTCDSTILRLMKSPIHQAMYRHNLTRSSHQDKLRCRGQIRTIALSLDGASCHYFDWAAGCG